MTDPFVPIRKGQIDSFGLFDRFPKVTVVLSRVWENKAPGDTEIYGK